MSEGSQGSIDYWRSANVKIRMEIRVAVVTRKLELLLGKVGY